MKNILKKIDNKTKKEKKISKGIIYKIIFKN